MRHVSFLEVGGDGTTVEERVNEWIQENEESILEIIDIEYIENGDMYAAIITYEERR